MIGLLDADSHNFPNLALMKISAFYKKHNEKVVWYNIFDKFDKVFVSKVFSFSDFKHKLLNAGEIIKGGTGFDLENKLPENIEKTFPDYSIYNIYDTAYGFLTRGCPRKCPFCIVSEKEGDKSIKVADLSNFWNGQKYIKLLDPNILASSEKYNLLQQLIDSKAKIDFTQGLDARMLTEKSIEYIKKIKVERLHFAWDGAKDSEKILENLINFKKETNYHYSKLGVYVLTNYDTDFEFDVYRVKKLKEIGFDPYVMIFEKDNCSKIYKDLQRYTNNKIIFRSSEWENYNKF